jgi:hypothetical protein
MSLEGIVIGAVGILLGAAFAFAGFRLFLLLLPLWGLFAGFMVGAGATATLLGESFLAGTVAIVVGVVVAIVFALLSWFYWWGAVAVVAGTLGYAVTHWALVAIGFSAEGWIGVVIAAAAGVVLAFVALLVNAPKYVAIILTAFSGAASLSAGVALVLGIIKPDDMANGSLVAIYTQGWVWIAIWAVVAAAGIVTQLGTSRRMEQDLAAQYAGRSPF